MECFASLCTSHKRSVQNEEPSFTHDCLESVTVGWIKAWMDRRESGKGNGALNASKKPLWIDQQTEPIRALGPPLCGSKTKNWTPPDSTSTPICPTCSAAASGPVIISESLSGKWRHSRLASLVFLSNPGTTDLMNHPESDPSSGQWEGISLPLQLRKLRLSELRGLSEAPEPIKSRSWVCFQITWLQFQDSVPHIVSGSAHQISSNTSFSLN